MIRLHIYPSQRVTTKDNGGSRDVITLKDINVGRPADLTENAAHFDLLAASHGFTGIISNAKSDDWADLIPIADIVMYLMTPAEADNIEQLLAAQIPPA